MADVGTGTTIAFGTSSFAQDVLDITHNDIARTKVITSHMGTTGEHTNMPGDLFDAGDLDVEILLDPDTQPPIGGVTETVTITFPNASTLIGTGFVSNWRFGVPLEDRMTATLTLTWDGLTGPAWA